MTRNQLIRATAKRSEYTIKVCDEIVRAVFDVMFDELEAHGYVTIPNFGKFYIWESKPKLYIDPVTREERIVESRKYPRFQATDLLKEAVQS